MRIYKEIFAHQAFADRPPVLMDIGASTCLPRNWQAIAKYSIGIVFDPDSRQMEYIKQERGYKKLFVYPKIVHDKLAGDTDFYLTSSPECSSTLSPDLENVKNYSFSPFFAVEKRLRLPATTVSHVLQELNIGYVDWFKTDTQGTDLRIFKSIPDELRHRIIIAELEPSIASTYTGEDKICDVMQYLDQEPFWCSNMQVQVSRIISTEILDKHFSGLMRKLINTVLCPSPCWAELTYFNDFKNDSFGVREFLLGWVFAMEEKQYGYAITLAENGKAKFDDQIFEKMKQISIRKINSSVWFNWNIAKKLLNKLLFRKQNKK